MIYSDVIQVQVLLKIVSEGNCSAIDKYNLTSDYFNVSITDENNKPLNYTLKDIFNYIKDYGKKYDNQAPSITTIQTQFSEFSACCNFVVDNTDSWTYLIDQLYADKLNGELNKLFNEQTHAIEIGVDPYKMLEIQKTTIAKIENTTSRHSKSFDIAHEGLKDIYEMYKQDKENKQKAIISTGFSDMDKNFGGWMRSGELAIIQGFMGSSKTFLLMKFLFNAWEKGFNVCLFEPEMTIKEISYRWISFKEHFSNWKLNYGEDIDQGFKIFAESKQDENKPQFLIVTPSMISTREDERITVSQLKQYCKDHNIDLLGVDGISTDYIYDNEMSEKAMDCDKLGHICKRLLDMSRELKMPVLSVVQRQRGPMDSEIDNSTVAGSKKIPDIATKMFALKREKGTTTSTLTITTTKNRFGRDDGVFQYEVDLDKQIWASPGSSTTSEPETEPDLTTQSNRRPND